MSRYNACDMCKNSKHFMRGGTDFYKCQISGRIYQVGDDTSECKEFKEKG